MKGTRIDLISSASLGSSSRLNGSSSGGRSSLLCSSSPEASYFLHSTHCLRKGSFPFSLPELPAPRGQGPRSPCAQHSEEFVPVLQMCRRSRWATEGRGGRLAPSSPQTCSASGSPLFLASTEDHDLVSTGSPGWFPFTHFSFLKKSRLFLQAETHVH